MKTSNNKNLLSAGMAIAIAMAAWLPTTATAADEPMKPMKGGEHAMMLQGVNTKQEVDALKTDDSIAMVCAKCKTVWVARVKQDAKGAQILMEGGKATTLIGTHASSRSRKSKPGGITPMTVTGIASR